MIDDLFVDGLQNIDVPGGLCSPEFGGEFGCRVGDVGGQEGGDFRNIIPDIFSRLFYSYSILFYFIPGRVFYVKYKVLGRGRRRSIKLFDILFIFPVV